MAGWSVVQSKSGNTIAGTTLIVTTNTAVAAGNKIIAAIAISAGGGASVTSLQDAALSNWTLVKNITNTTVQMTALYALDVPAGDAGSTVALKVTCPNASDISMLVQEVSGLAAGNTLAAMIDGTAGTLTGSALGSTGSPVYASTAAGEYLVSVYGDDGGPITWTVPAGYTGDANGVNTNGHADIEIAYENSTGGTETGSYTLSGTATAWSMIMVAFKTGAVVASPIAVPHGGRYWRRNRKWRHRLTPTIDAPPTAAVPSNISIADQGVAGDEQITTSQPAAIADQGVAGDEQLAAVQPTALPDQGLATDGLAIGAIPAAIADQGIATDALTVSQPVSVADQGLGTDAVSAGFDTRIADQGIAGSETFTTAQPTALADQGISGTGALAAQQTVAIADQGIGADQVSTPVTLTDASAAVDALATVAAAAVADQGVAGSETLATTQPAGVADAGTGQDAFSGGQAGAPILTEAGTGSEALAAQQTAYAASLADAGAASDGLAAIQLTGLTDAGTATDVITLPLVITPLYDTAAGLDVTGIAMPAPGILSDAGVATDVIIGPPLGYTGTVTWQAGPAPARWQADAAAARWAAALSQLGWTVTASPARWRAAPAPARWEILVAEVAPVYSGSLEQINVTWTSDLDGTSVDPTGQTIGQAALAVQMAFPGSSGDPLHPAPPVTWYAATWLAGGTGKGYIAQCLIGPGGAVTLTAGKYDVWSWIQGAPEQPKKYAYTLTVY